MKKRRKANKPTAEKDTWTFPLYLSMVISKMDADLLDTNIPIELPRGCVGMVLAWESPDAAKQHYSDVDFDVFTVDEKYPAGRSA